jgi:hypothetical protein
VTVRDLYQSVPFVVGFILVLLGTVNSIVGMTESKKYQKVIAKTAQTGLEENYRNFQELTRQQNEQVLSRINEEQARYNIGRVRLDFFHVVFSGGQLLLLIGLITISYSLIRMIRHETSLRIQRISAKKEPVPEEKAKRILGKPQ